MNAMMMPGENRIADSEATAVSVQVADAPSPAMSVCDSDEDDVTIVIDNFKEPTKTIPPKYGPLTPIMCDHENAKGQGCLFIFWHTCSRLRPTRLAMNSGDRPFTCFGCGLLFTHINHIYDNLQDDDFETCNLGLYKCPNIRKLDGESCNFRVLHTCRLGCYAAKESDDDDHSVRSVTCSCGFGWIHKSCYLKRKSVSPALLVPIFHDIS